MLFLDSTRKSIRPFVQISILLFQLLPIQLVFGEEDQAQHKDCPEDIFEDSTRCTPPGVYYAIIDGETCQTTVNFTNGDCSRGELTWQLNSTIIEEEKVDSQIGRSLDANTSLPSSSCQGAVGSSNITTNPSPSASCYSYSIPVCEASRHELNIWTVGGSDATNRSTCYDIKINGIKVPKVIYSNLLAHKTCPRTEVLIPLKANEGLTELGNGRTQKFQLLAEQFDLVVCFHICGNESGSLQVSSVSMTKVGGRSGLAKQCIQTKDKAVYSNCEQYNGMTPSRCWGHGCQYYLQGSERCIAGSLSCEVNTYRKCLCGHKFCENLNYEKCAPDSLIFANKLTCRRAKSYYIYHPKTACYAEKDSGDCTGATTTYGVNLLGAARTDFRGIKHIADADSGWRDPNNTREGIYVCLGAHIIGDKGHVETSWLYYTAYVGRANNKAGSNGLCIYYPVPICQNGEYMLTLKLVEGNLDYGTPKRRCTEARINDVPIMVHLDNVLLGTYKCVVSEVVLMFLAVGGDDNNPKSDYTLHLKGHVEPIQVKGGQMDLQFCSGWDCVYDHNPMVSAFSLERLGEGTKECKRASG